MVTIDTIYRGLRSGIGVIIELAKVIIPITIVVTFLEQSGLLKHIAGLFAPFMGLFGLPGETALALALGNFSNYYAGIAVITAIDLTAKQITIIGVMFLLCHSLLIETAIVIKAGGRPIPIVLSRIGSCLAAGLFLNMVL
ncbi:MAG: nucleoside recognition domain-containing protein [bacterium]|jgi:hypothetical protein